ncbi:unnamed protein product [Cylindrotheca closterium]|uniref:Uncharacterized protein n=1 Tax=Cylindrotheca closterium TaxID=2856 RepID=A0AAD2JMI4_9STRA|nr:unnamed protein product [Cylindrotheca closterium]
MAGKRGDASAETQGKAKKQKVAAAKSGPPVDPMIREMEYTIMLGTSLDLRILPRKDLISLSNGFIQRAKELNEPRVVVGYKEAEQSHYDQIRQSGFTDEDGVWRNLNSCMPDVANPPKKRRFWFVATVLENPPQLETMDQMTTKDIGSPSSVLPLACLEPKTFKKPHSEIIELSAVLSKRLRGIINDHLKSELGLQVIKSESDSETEEEDGEEEEEEEEK